MLLYGHSALRPRHVLVHAAPCAVPMSLFVPLGGTAHSLVGLRVADLLVVPSSVSVLH